MSVVHRVIILNRPLKIRGFSAMQWVLIAVGVALGVAAFSIVPKDWKVLNAPAGVFVFVAVVGGVLFFIKACELRPAVWWQNMLTYRLKIAPDLFLPRPESGKIYPDPTMVEPGKAEDRPYVS